MHVLDGSIQQVDGRRRPALPINHSSQADNWSSRKRDRQWQHAEVQRHAEALPPQYTARDAGAWRVQLHSPQHWDAETWRGKITTHSPQYSDRNAGAW